MPNVYDIAENVRRRNRGNLRPGADINYEYGPFGANAQSSAPAGWQGQTSFIPGDYYVPPGLQQDPQFNPYVNEDANQIWYEEADPTKKHASFSEALESTGGDPEMERKVAFLNYQEAQKKQQQKRAFAMNLLQEQRQRAAMVQSARQKQADRNYYQAKDLRTEQLRRRDAANTAIYRQGMLDPTNASKYLGSFEGTPQERELFRLAMVDRGKENAYTLGQRETAVVNKDLSRFGGMLEEGQVDTWSKLGIEQGYFPTGVETKLIGEAEDYNKTADANERFGAAALARYGDLGRQLAEAKAEDEDSEARDVQAEMSKLLWEGVRNGLLEVTPDKQIHNAWTGKKRFDTENLFQQPAEKPTDYDEPSPLSPPPQRPSRGQRPRQGTQQQRPIGKQSQQELDAREERGRKHREEVREWRWEQMSEEEKAALFVKEQEERDAEAQAISDRRDRDRETRLELARGRVSGSSSAVTRSNYRKNPELIAEDIWLTDPNIQQWKQDEIDNPNKNIDDPNDKYDYRAAIMRGVRPQQTGVGNEWHWPSEHKDADHPTRWQYNPDGSVVDSIDGTVYPTWKDASKADPEFGPDPAKADPENYGWTANPLDAPEGEGTGEGGGISEWMQGLIERAQPTATPEQPPTVPPAVAREVAQPPTNAPPRRDESRQEGMTGLTESQWNSKLVVEAAAILRERGDEDATVDTVAQLLPGEMAALMRSAAIRLRPDFFRLDRGAVKIPGAPLQGI